MVLSPGDGEPDPLNLWDGAAGVDSQGEHPSFLPAEPAFEGDDVRVFRVVALSASRSSSPSASASSSGSLPVVAAGSVVGDGGL